ncbi:hypothetical protein [Quadrisphaera sp. DSM 44207]|uniref:hypothetical protein n=1 Tax=Quadrisphaera sp. DSM 44207 TaxID=1881057 RepID=UPI000880F956|nr:hypothetical protein [Quadrisphaera sp. DSM 44207]SDQ66896.1 Chromosome partitioning ATPase, Mrp family, contains Fe-S cluster [Quadrisphaera sp. DSM 44207]
MELKQIGRALRRQGAVALAAFAVVVLAMALAAVTTSARYTSATTLYVQPTSAEGATGSVAAVQFLMPALEELVTSAPTREQVAAAVPQVAQQADWTVDGSADPGTGLLRIEVVSTDRDVPLPVADAYTTVVQGYAQSVSTPVLVSVIDPPGAPTSDTRIRVASLLVSGVVLGLIAAVLVGLLVDRLRTPRRLADTIRDRLGVPVLGEVPRVPRRAADASPRVVFERDDQPVVDAFMQLRTNLEIQMDRTQVRSLAVTAGAQTEERVVITANLAWSLASAGRTVLLVEADLRGGVLGAVMAPSVAPTRPDGPAAALPQAERTTLEALSFLPADGLRRTAVDSTGTASSRMHPSEVVTTGLPALVASSRADGPLLVVDSPPIGWSGEGNYVAAKVDAVLLIADGRRSGADEQVSRMVDQVHDAGGSVIGVVLSNARPPRRDERRKQRLVRARHAEEGGREPLPRRERHRELQPQRPPAS